MGRQTQASKNRTKARETAVRSENLAMKEINAETQVLPYHPVLQTSNTPQTAEVQQPPKKIPQNKVLAAFENMRRLPDELKLEILGYVVNLPNGLHSDRWEMVYPTLVKPLLASNRDVARVVPELLYRTNTIILRPKKRVYEAIPLMIWPKPAVNTYVRKLVLEFQEGIVFHTGREWRATTSILNFLIRLADGSAGFENLRLLRLVFEDMKKGYGNNAGDMDGIIENVLKNGPLTCRAKKLEVSVAGHECSDACDLREEKYRCKACSDNRQIRKIITVNDGVSGTKDGVSGTKPEVGV